MNTHQPQLAQQTIYPACLVFDFGGLGLVGASHKDVRKRKPETRCVFTIARNAATIIHIPGDTLTVLNAETGRFYLERA